MRPRGMTRRGALHELGELHFDAGRTLEADDMR
jgi:hypothetical protein